MPETDRPVVCPRCGSADVKVWGRRLVHELTDPTGRRFRRHDADAVCRACGVPFLATRVRAAGPPADGQSPA